MRAPRVPALLGAALLGAAPAVADADEPPLAIAASIEAGFTWDSAHPADGQVSGWTIAWRDRLPAVQLALLGATVTLGRFSARVVGGAGDGLEALHAPTDPRGTVNPLWTHLVEARAGYTLPIGRGLTVDAGLFPSHLGHERFATADNFEATHAFIADATPYYFAGVRASYPFSDHLAATLLWLNGWDLVEQDHGFRSAGAQLRWTSARVAAALDLFAGPARHDPRAGPRVLVDLWMQLYPIPALTIAASLDLGADPRLDGGGIDTWFGGLVYVRLRPIEWLAFTLRSEIVDDGDAGLVTGARQRLAEMTLTTELAAGPFTLRLEGRVDRADAPTLDGHDGRELVVVSMIARCP